MRYNSLVYKDLELPDGHEYADLFSFDRSFSSLVAFQPNMKLPFHRWFYYKPGFSYALVDKLYKKYFAEQKELHVFDPFCGVGTTPLWAYENGHIGTGSDVSPLAIFISECKAIRKIDINSFISDTENIINNIKYYDAMEIKHFLPENIPYYFKKGFDEHTRNKILYILHLLKDIKEEKNRKLILLSLMKASYDVSYTIQNGGFLRYIDESRYSNLEERLMFHVGDMIRDFKIKGQRTLIIDEKEKVSRKEPLFLIMDARKLDLPNDLYDFVVTSPPYLNRYDYTRIYAIEMGLLGISDEEIKSLRKNTIKSHVEAEYKNCLEMKSSIFDRSYEELLSSKLSNPQIPEMSKGYYNDLACNLCELKRVVKKGGIISFVVGNSRFSGIHFETDSILAEIGENIGLKVKEIIVTKLRGSSAQQIRMYGDAQLRESIVTFQV